MREKARKFKLNFSFSAGTSFGYVNNLQLRLFKFEVTLINLPACSN